MQVSLQTQAEPGVEQRATHPVLLGCDLTGRTSEVVFKRGGALEDALHTCQTRHIALTFLCALQAKQVAEQTSLARGLEKRRGWRYLQRSLRSASWSDDSCTTLLV